MFVVQSAIVKLVDYWFDHCRGCRTNEAIVGYVTLCLLKGLQIISNCHTGPLCRGVGVLESLGSRQSRLTGNLGNVNRLAYRRAWNNLFNDTIIASCWLKSHLGLRKQPHILDPVTVLTATNLSLITPSYYTN